MIKLPTFHFQPLEDELIGVDGHLIHNLSKKSPNDTNLGESLQIVRHREQETNQKGRKGRAKCGKTGQQAHITKWDPEQVLEMVERLGFPTQAFEDYQVDGKELILLDEKKLMDKFELSEMQAFSLIEAVQIELQIQLNQSRFCQVHVFWKENASSWFLKSRDLHAFAFDMNHTLRFKPKPELLEAIASASDPSRDPVVSANLYCRLLVLKGHINNAEESSAEAIFLGPKEVRRVCKSEKKELLYLLGKVGVSSGGVNEVANMCIQLDNMIEVGLIDGVLNSGSANPREVKMGWMHIGSIQNALTSSIRLCFVGEKWPVFQDTERLTYCLVWKVLVQRNARGCKGLDLTSFYTCSRSFLVQKKRSVSDSTEMIPLSAPTMAPRTPNLEKQESLAQLSVIMSAAPPTEPDVILDDSLNIQELMDANMPSCRHPSSDDDSETESMSQSRSESESVTDDENEATLRFEEDPIWHDDVETKHEATNTEFEEEISIEAPNVKCEDTIESLSIEDEEANDQTVDSNQDQYVQQVQDALQKEVVKHVDQDHSAMVGEIQEPLAHDQVSNLQQEEKQTGVIREEHETFAREMTVEEEDKPELIPSPLREQLEFHVEDGKMETENITLLLENGRANAFDEEIKPGSPLQENEIIDLRDESETELIPNLELEHEPDNPLLEEDDEEEKTIDMTNLNLDDEDSKTNTPREPEQAEEEIISESKTSAPLDEAKQSFFAEEDIVDGSKDFQNVEGTDQVLPELAISDVASGEGGYAKEIVASLLEDSLTITETRLDENVPEVDSVTDEEHGKRDLDETQFEISQGFVDSVFAYLEQKRNTNVEEPRAMQEEDEANFQQESENEEVQYQDNNEEVDNEAETETMFGAKIQARPRRRTVTPKKPKKKKKLTKPKAPKFMDRIAANENAKLEKKQEEERVAKKSLPAQAVLTCANQYQSEKTKRVQDEETVRLRLAQQNWGSSVAVEMGKCSERVRAMSRIFLLATERGSAELDRTDFLQPAELLRKHAAQLRSTLTSNSEFRFKELDQFSQSELKRKYQRLHKALQDLEGRMGQHKI